jgi:beta-phosphoglucomutase-like phosphatase (HAD superfamily)
VIKGLLLDFYGTVVEDDDAIMQAIADQVAADASTSVSGADVMDAWVREYEAVAAGPQFRTLRDCAMQSLDTVMADVGYADDTSTLCATQFRYWQSPPLRPGTQEFLSRVTVPICVVSDVDRADLHAAMAHHGLAFTAVVTSEDVRAYKRTGPCSPERSPRWTWVRTRCCMWATRSAPTCTGRTRPASRQCGSTDAGTPCRTTRPSHTRLRT